jgi:hypothetical protein
MKVRVNLETINLKYSRPFVAICPARREVCANVCLDNMELRRDKYHHYTACKVGRRGCSCSTNQPRHAHHDYSHTKSPKKSVDKFTSRL